MKKNYDNDHVQIIAVKKAKGSMTNSLTVATKKMMHDIDLRCEITFPLPERQRFLNMRLRWL